MSKMTIKFKIGMKEIINHDTLRTEMQMSVISFHFNEVRRLLARCHLIRYSSTCIVNSISQRMCNDKYVSKYHVDIDNGNNHSKGRLYSPGGVDQAPI